MPKNAKPLVSRGGEVVCPERLDKKESTVSTAYCKEKCKKCQDFGRTEPDPQTNVSYRTVLCEGYFGLSDIDLKKYEEKQEEFFRKKDAEGAKRKDSLDTEIAVRRSVTHPHHDDYD